MACSGNGGSEYAENYRAWPLPQRIHARALPEPKKSEAPFVDMTTHKADYAPKKIHPRLRPVGAPGPSPWSHYADCVSEYALRYQAKPVQPRIRPTRPDANAGCAVPFDGISTQKADFQKWPLKPRAHAKPKPEPAETPGDSESPFTESSTYALSFWDKSKCMPAKVRANPPPPPGTGPFEGVSVMRSDYVAKPITPRVRAPPPSASALPFRGESCQFEGRESPPKLDAPPNPGECGAKFSGETTYSAEFRQRELPRRLPAPPRPRSSLS